MKNHLKLGLAGALTLLLAAQAVAQNGTTNMVQNLTIQLTGYYQADPSTNSTSGFRNAVKVTINNSDVINLLGLQVNLVFSKNAKLIVKRPAGDPTGQVYVRDTVNGNKVDTNVDPYFQDIILGRVAKTKTNMKSMATTGTAYTVEEFKLTTDFGSFDVSGFVTENITTSTHAGTTYEFRSGTLKVSGIGTYLASPASPSSAVPVVLTGTVNVSGKSIEH